MMVLFCADVAQVAALPKDITGNTYFDGQCDKIYTFLCI
jgi:hypothetical protein